MAWQARLVINNNTNYKIDVVHNLPEGDLGNVEPGQQGWTFGPTQDVNNTMSLRFWEQPNVWFMQGSCSFGPQAGVYADRGWMDPNAQTIRLTAEAGGRRFVQTTNGGEELLAWNEFEGGGPITYTFDNIS
tara:strand:+ start:247 stop:639 length:393 start_codon:yes stop_codon:yes gene_type:complete